jgi:osmotically-inducible protein OsmY
MSEREAREELERRYHDRNRDPYSRDPYRRDDDRSWWEPFGLGRGALYGRGYGWPYVLPRYDDLGYDPDAPLRADRRRGRTEHHVEQRDCFDRAGDEIASWFGDEAAEARREADHRGRGPKGYVRADARIEEDVNDRLTDDPEVDASDIIVAVKDREVTLDGTVHSRAAKRAAEDCADSVSGVVHVQNNLRVHQPPG